MTEQKLSLDETIELARKFNELDLWELSGSNTLVSDNFNGLAMLFIKRYIGLDNYIQENYDLVVDSVSGDYENKTLANTTIAKYSLGYSSHRPKEEGAKLEELYSEIYPKAVEVRKAKDRKSIEEKIARQLFLEVQANKAVENARKLIRQ